MLIEQRTLFCKVSSGQGSFNLIYNNLNITFFS
uniref:Uncharacterized protein n=1 Tax=Rhizophora mucronata TaxID=61149 RepID=A0A2P2NVL7_RHIMU